MRKILAVLAIGLACFSAQAQIGINTNTSPPTLTGPGMDALNILTTATNWIVAPFVEYNSKSDSHSQYGGGLAAVVNLNEAQTIATMIRVDYVGGSWWMPSADLQLQLPIHMGTNFVLTPFAFSGIAMPLGGSEDKGDVAGLVGAGMDLKFNKLSKHWSMAFDLEYWSNMDGVQYRFSPFVWRF